MAQLVALIAVNPSLAEVLVAVALILAVVAIALWLWRPGRVVAPVLAMIALVFLAVGVLVLT
jgi:hypothetical protein